MRYIRYMKYEHARQSLRDNLFKVSTASEFNDPSECRARFISSGEVPALRSYIHDNYDRLKVECIRRMNSFSPETQKILTEDTIYKWYLESGTRPDEVREIEKFDKQFFMMCLVKERGLKADADTLMWSHYADNGRGLRITFDFPPRGRFYIMKVVDYVENVPCFDVSSFDVWMQGELFGNYIETIISTKGLAWSYENEARMIVPSELPGVGRKHIVEKSINSDAVIQCVRINYDAIRRIDFGPCVPMDGVVECVRDLKQNSQTSHIAYFKVDLDPEKYRYKYKRIQCV